MQYQEQEHPVSTICKWQQQQPATTNNQPNSIEFYFRMGSEARFPLRTNCNEIFFSDAMEICGINCEKIMI